MCYSFSAEDYWQWFSHFYSAHYACRIIQLRREDVPLDIHRRLSFQHDGATPHFASAVHYHLNRCLRQRWIRRDGPTAWPRRSPDLTPLDFFFCGTTRSLWCIRPLWTLWEDLLARVLGAVQEIQQTPSVMESVYQNMSHRYNVCY